MTPHVWSWHLVMWWLRGEGVEDVGSRACLSSCSGQLPVGSGQSLHIVNIHYIVLQPVASIQHWHLSYSEHTGMYDC
jgi:hypothetical protein